MIFEYPQTTGMSELCFNKILLSSIRKNKQKSKRLFPADYGYSKNDTVYIDNIFHELQDYENKMN